MTELILEQREGPLEPAILEEISRLYGGQDPKYLAIEFCDQLFNRNPLGRSLHVFARTHKGRHVGHYALIPLFVSSPDGRCLSAKGEAFFLEEEYRAVEVTTAHGAAPVAIVMAQMLYRTAAQAGISVVHLIADERVGLLHQLAGCRRLRITVKQELFFLRPRPFRKSHFVRNAALTCIYGFHKAMFAYAWLRARFTQGVVGQVDDELLRIAMTLRVGNSQQWSFSLDCANLSWVNGTGRVGGARLPSGAFALWSRPNENSGICYLLAWYVPEGRGACSRTLLDQVLLGSDRFQASLLALPHLAAVDKRSLKALIAVCRRRCFLSRSDPRNVYVFSYQSYYLEMNNLALSPLFHAVF